MKRNDGFTLIELLVTISAGALVTFAAVSLLLLGARVQYTTTQEAQEQQTVRIVMSLLEDMAGSGAFNVIEPTEYSGWRLLDCLDVNKPEDGTVVFEYDAATGSIYRGEADDETTPLLTGLNNAVVTMEGKLMRLSFETDGGANYVTRVYCRTVDVEDNMSENDEGHAGEHAASGQAKVTAGRIAFLETLAQQYYSGQNTGRINGVDKYYSHWYIGDAGWGKNGWNKDTPWCACFVSWAAVNMPGSTITKGSPFVFANVDEGMKAFKQADGDRWEEADGSHIPDPGDYIFFDWTGEQKDPAHVGVVLDVANEIVDGVTRTYIYTIEGNSSGRVAVRKYKIGDPVIMGYGVLPDF